MTTIAIRTRPGAGFWKDIKIHDERNCEICGQELALGPSGKLYCNNWEPDHDQPKRYINHRSHRIGNVTAKLTFDTIDQKFRVEWIRASSDATSNNGAVGEEDYPTYAAAELAWEHAFEDYALQEAK